MGETVANFSNGPICPKPECRPWSHQRDDRCAAVFINFAHSSVLPAQIIPLDKLVAPFGQQLLRYRGKAREGVVVRIGTELQN